MLLVAQLIATVSPTFADDSSPASQQEAQQVVFPPQKVPFSFDNGFAKLQDRVGIDMGEALSSEYSEAETGHTQQVTSKGLAYYIPDKVIGFTNGAHHWGFDDAGRLREWDSEDVLPPPLPVVAAPVVDFGSTASGGYQLRVRLTYYLLSGRMRNGEYVHTGAVACSSNIRMGSTIVFPKGERGVCKDTGLLGSSGWVDAWGQYGIGLYRTYGDYVTVTVAP